MLILIDAHSKWIEAFTATTRVTIELLRSVFGLVYLKPYIVAVVLSVKNSDNLKSNGIKQVTSAPYHPASNGLAERAVRIVKKGLKKMNQI